jgi:lipoprotein-anchoring transpeptidase ErfK/SrfK
MPHPTSGRRALTLLVTLAVAAAALTACRESLRAAAPAAASSAASSQPALGSPSAVTSPSPAVPKPSASPSPTSTATALPTSTKLRRGSKGAAVKVLQQQLTALGYWNGTANGKFGDATQQAVYALQKAARQKATGVVTSATWKDLVMGVRPKAKSKSGSGKIIEVDLGRQLLLFVNDGQVEYILHTSTGGGYVYYENGHREVAVTPKGHFRTYRSINGPHRSPLGLLIRPRYFNGGIAIHGEGSVPPYPASHGCVRVSNAAIDWIWSEKLDPIGMRVWVY